MLLLSNEQIAVDRLNRPNKFDQLSRQRKNGSFTPCAYVFVVDRAGTIQKRLWRVKLCLNNKGSG